MAKVLVVEDDRRLREILVDLLLDAGYDVEEAKNRAEALEKVRFGQPDIILLDVWMPVMDGFQVLKTLRQETATADLPVVLLTALPTIEGEQEGFKLGVNHYIPKPFNPETVKLTIKVALRELEGLDDNPGRPTSVWAGSTSYRRNTGDLASQEIIRTGDALALLEQKLGGGIAIGSLTLIEGDPTTGKSVLCQHLTHGSILAGHPVGYFTSENTTRSLLKQMESIGLSISTSLKDDQIRIYPIPEPDPSEDAGPLLAALAMDIERLPPKYNVVVIDSITDLATYSQAQQVVSLFSSLKRLCGNGRTLIVVADSHAFDPPFLARMATICDAHLSLRKSKVRSKVVHMATVVKANNAQLDKDNLISFEVEAATGIRIIPYSQAKV